VVIGSTGAGYTAKDCDFLCDGTDDPAQFNAAVAELAPGGELKVLDGEYILSSPLVIKGSDIKLSGCGKAVLRMTGVRNANSDAANAKSNNATVYVEGNNNVIEGLTLANGETITAGICYGIYLIGERNIIKGNVFSNRAYVNACYGVYMYSSLQNTVTDNIFRNEGVSYGVFVNQSRRIVVKGNIIQNTSIYNGNYSYGIYLYYSEGNSILGNIIGNYGYVNNQTSYGIYITESKRNTVNGNIFNNESSETPAYGLYMGSQSAYNAITNNTFHIAGNPVYGIYMINVYNNLITNNIYRIVNYQRTVYGLYMTECKNSTISLIAGFDDISFSGFALYIAGANNTYNQIINCNLKNWAQYGTGVLTLDGTTAAVLPGSSTTVADFGVIGEGSVAGFNMVNELPPESNGSYSPAEVKTGAVWTDGKPVYKRTVAKGDIANAGGPNDYELLPAGYVDKLIKAEGYFISPENYQLILPFYEAFNVDRRVWIYKHADTSVALSVRTEGATDVVLSDVTVTLYYTKV
jgi:parallel beta-helix repeat protein